MVLSNPGNDHVSGIAGIAQEPVSMTPRLMAVAGSNGQGRRF